MIPILKEKPLVSIIVISYNHEKYIKQCLDGLFSQTYDNVEIILRDDGSTDNTQSIINNYLKERQGLLNIQLDLDKNNKGLLWSLNNTLSKAKGEFISLCAGDDYYLPEKIDLQIGLFKKTGNKFGIVYGDMEVVDENNKTIFNSFYEWHLKGEMPPSGNVLEHFILHNPIHMMSLLVKKEIYDSVGQFDENLIFEDWDMAMRMSRITEFYYHPEKVASYRKHSGQMTDVYWANEEKYNKILESIFELLSKHLDLAKYRKPISKNLFKIFLKQISQNSLTRREKLDRSSFLINKNFTLENAGIHFLIFLNIDKFAVGTLRKIISSKK